MKKIVKNKNTNKNAKPKLKIKLHKDFVILLILVIILISLLPFYIFKIKDIIYSNSFANYVSDTYSNYINPIFSIEKIVYYTSAFVTDNSEDNNFQNINIGEYTDIAVYINNTRSSDELNDENTISELYIDNIKVESKTNKGQCLLGYKNPYYFATYRGIEAPANGRIDFNIITTNKDNKESAYNTPSFYQDCSNPISLGYTNKDIVTNFEIANTDTLAINGSILKKANIPTEDLAFNMSFKIHIKNNKNEEFICNVNRPVLNGDFASGIYDGYIATQFTPDEGTYQFIKISN